jgi:hypothetical protein
MHASDGGSELGGPFLRPCRRPLFCECIEFVCVCVRSVASPRPGRAKAARGRLEYSPPYRTGPGEIRPGRRHLKTATDRQINDVPPARTRGRHYLGAQAAWAAGGRPNWTLSKRNRLETLY